MSLNSNLYEEKPQFRKSLTLSMSMNDEKVDFDAEEYQGMWYEVGRYPFAYEQDCKSSAARYVYDAEKGGIHVVNICYSDSHFENISTYDQGFARQVGGEGKEGDFRIKFLRPGTIEANYIVLETDNKNYSIVGELDKDLLWILVRDPRVTRKMLNFLLNKIETLGFDRQYVMINESIIF